MQYKEQEKGSNYIVITIFRETRLYIASMN